MPNTQITYMYRDASNWKQFETVILWGEMNDNDIETILSRLTDHNLFLPEQVGLPRLQHRWENLNEDDGIYHELKLEDFTKSDLEPTVDMTAQELVENFRKVEWDIKRSIWTLWLGAKIDPQANINEIIKMNTGRIW